MNKSILFVSAGTVLFALSSSAWADDPPTAGAAPMHHAAAAEGAKPAPTDDELVASAMKAAPKKVAENATIVVPEAKGGMRTLRKGSNGFTCMPDNPEPRDPIRCAGQECGDWIDAYLNHKTPPAGKVGLMYMLSGGTDASNTDPYATKPSRPTIGSRLDRTS